MKTYKTRIQLGKLPAGTLIGFYEDVTPDPLWFEELPEGREECESCGSGTSVHAPDCDLKGKCKHEPSKQAPDQWIEAQAKMYRKGRESDGGNTNDLDRLEGKVEAIIDFLNDQHFTK